MSAARPYIDLIARLRALARCEHDDHHSIGDEAADAIMSLLDDLDTLAMHATPDIASGWMSIPECEWEQVMRSVFEK